MTTPDPADDPLADLGGLPPDVPPGWYEAIEAEVGTAQPNRPAPPSPDPLTAADLWRVRWYPVPDDEVGGWALATVNRPTSTIDPVATRDRVLAWLVWEEHARWLARSHNLSLGYADEPEPEPLPQPEES